MQETTPLVSLLLHRSLSSMLSMLQAKAVLPLRELTHF